jgi:predicted MFS family arabinose efflux permease
MAVATGWLLVLGTRVVLPALLPQVRAEFAIDNATAGFLVTLMWAAYATTQFPAGILLDRFGERPTMVVSVLATGSGALALTLAPSFVLFALGAVLFGLGSGLYAPPRVTVLSRAYPERDGTALGVTFAVGNLGAAMLPVIAAVLAVRFGWRAGFAVVVPPLVVVAVGLWLFVPKQGASGTEGGRAISQTASRLLTAVTSRRVILAWSAMTLALFAYQGIVAFLPTYLVDMKGFGQGTASLVYGLFYASGAVSQWAAGNGADWLGERQVLTGVAAFGVLPLVALPFLGGIPLIAAVLLLGTRLGLGPVGNGYVAAVLPADAKGIGFGFFRTLYLAVGATGSMFVGVFAERGLFDESFLALAVITAVAAALYWLLPAADQFRENKTLAARSSFDND